MGIGWFKQVHTIEKYGNIKPHLLEIMEKAYQQGEYKATLVVTEIILKYEPKNQYVIFYTAKSYHKLKQYRKAEQICLKFIKESENMKLIGLLIKMYKEQFQYDKALNFLYECDKKFKSGNLFENSFLDLKRTQIHQLKNEMNFAFDIAKKNLMKFGVLVDIDKLNKEDPDYKYYMQHSNNDKKDNIKWNINNNTIDDEKEICRNFS